MGIDVADAALSQQLDGFFRRFDNILDKVVFPREMALVKRFIQEGWPVDTGLSRGAWHGPRRIKRHVWEISTNIIYAWVIEYGGYRGVGPKTRRLGAHRVGEFLIGAGIYVRQRPSAPARRALAKIEPRLLGAITATLVTEWRK